MFTRRVFCFIFIAILAVSTIKAPAYADLPSTDKLSACLVESTTDKDREILIRWLAFGIAVHPALRDDFVAVDESVSGQTHKYIAFMFMKLLADTCKEEFQTAIKNGGQIALETSFSILGEVAANNVFAHPDVIQEMERFTQYLDADEMEDLIK